MEVIFLTYPIQCDPLRGITFLCNTGQRDKVYAQTLSDLIRCNSIQECFPNEPLSGYGMGFQTSTLQSLTFLCIIPLLLQYELVDKSTNKSGLRRHIGFTENFREGQHSLTSVERPSYLRSDFVYVWRHARLEVQYVIHLHLDRLYPTRLIFG